MSVISNGDLEITQTYTMIDTGSSTPGIAQGLAPAEVGLDKHKLKPDSLLEKMKVAG